MSVFRVEALPAREGDCLVVSYGEPDQLRHVMIDAGHSTTGKALAAHLSDRGVGRIEVLIVTHVDADHIEGVLDFLELVTGRIEIGDVWFNGWRHLNEGLESFGPAQGERLTTLLGSMPWNEAADGRAIRVRDDGRPRTMPELAGGLVLTVLSPDVAKLRRMIPSWEKACRGAGLVPGEGGPGPESKGPIESFGADLEALASVRTKDDSAAANGTSIAVLVEYDGRRVLFGTDAHPDILVRSLERLGDGRPVVLDLFKIPHHGSQANVTQALLRAVECRDFLVSTDGTRFGHPDETAIARIVVGGTGGVRLWFNYRQPRTEIWEERAQAETEHRFECRFPEEDGILRLDVGS